MSSKQYLQFRSTRLSEQNILYSNGDIRSAKRLINKLKKEFNEDTKYFKYTERGEVFYIPNLTARLILTTKYSFLLGDVRCINCNNKIIMKYRTIINEEIRNCPICNNDLYEKDYKKILSKKKCI